MDKTLVEMRRLCAQWLAGRDLAVAPEVAEGMAARFAELDRVLCEGGNLPDEWATPLRKRCLEEAEMRTDLAKTFDVGTSDRARQQGMATAWRGAIKVLGLGK